MDVGRHLLRRMVPRNQLIQPAGKREEEFHQLENKRARLSLPDAAAMDKIKRYEIVIDRELYRAMNPLERLQPQRSGESVPPPVNIDVSGEK